MFSKILGVFKLFLFPWLNIMFVYTTTQSTYMARLLVPLICFMHPPWLAVADAQTSSQILENTWGKYMEVS